MFFYLYHLTKTISGYVKTLHDSFLIFNQMVMSKIKLCSGLNGIIFLFVALFFLSCSEDDVEEVVEPVSFANVDKELVPYFERFQQEAAARGISVDLSAADIEGVIEDLEGEHVAGQCAYGRFNSPRLVTVDAVFWRRSSNLFKEFIVFHELGHCYLNRGHLESSFSNGVCTSIMRSGVGDCFDNYNTRTREYYIDELFGPDLPL